ncbi:HprK-related kinase A [Yunchengibacter salinarum]|uniref:HprK-related kinase A n=1 Tax=Yunchengibacter salinarum TaxID=3133399 RepID=UPI0035B6579D
MTEAVRWSARDVPVRHVAMGEVSFACHRVSGDVHALNFLALAIVDAAREQPDTVPALAARVRAAVGADDGLCPDSLVERTVRDLARFGLLAPEHIPPPAMPLWPGPPPSLTAPPQPGGQRLDSLSRDDLAARLASGRLVLTLGPFRQRLTMPFREGIAHMQDAYGAVSIHTLPHGETGFCDHHVRLGSGGGRLARVLRGLPGVPAGPQITPLDGGGLDIVPLPRTQAPLAIEMAFNLQVALRTARFALFHAGVVARGESGLLLAATSGGGKSTLTALLMEKGYRLLSDEFALMALGAAAGRVYPYPRPVSLKNESIPVVRAVVGAGALSAVLHDTPKGRIAYRRPRASDIADAGRPVRISRVLFPVFEQGRDEGSLTPVPKADAMMRLMTGSPNLDRLGEEGFTALTALLDGAPAFELRYGTADQSLALVARAESETGEGLS